MLGSLELLCEAACQLEQAVVPGSNEIKQRTKGKSSESSRLKNLNRIISVLKEDTVDSQLPDIVVPSVIPLLVRGDSNSIQSQDSNCSSEDHLLRANLSYDNVEGQIITTNSQYYDVVQEVEISDPALVFHEDSHLQHYDHSYSMLSAPYDAQTEEETVPLEPPFVITSPMFQPKNAASASHEPTIITPGSHTGAVLLIPQSSAATSEEATKVHADKSITSREKLSSAEETAMEKLLDKRARNNLACKKSRLRRKVRQKERDDEVRQLEETNATLREWIQSLEVRVEAQRQQLTMLGVLS